MFFIEPITDHQSLFLSQPHRMRIFHTLFSIRLWVFSFFKPQSDISSQYQAFEEIIELHYPPFNLPGHSDKIQLNKFRSSMKEILIGLYPKRNVQTCQIEPITFECNDRQVLSYSIRDGINYNWTEINRKFILYIHGGEFVSGDIETYSGYECYLSREYRMPVVHIEYSLSPEHSLLDAIDEIITVYMSMLKIDPNVAQRMIGMGDSSGGSLWLRAIQKLIEKEQDVPLALILHSPWVDISLSYIEFDEYKSQKRVFFTHSLLHILVEVAFNNTDDNTDDNTELTETIEPLDAANPYDYSFKGFPPLYVTVGTEETLLLDSYTLRSKILENNGQIILDEGYGLMHMYSMFHLWSPEAQSSQERVRKFIEQL
jgi:acetyl esterase/lipase